jgi:hypothetical protein
MNKSEKHRKDRSRHKQTMPPSHPAFWERLKMMFGSTGLRYLAGLFAAAIFGGLIAGVSTLLDRETPKESATTVDVYYVHSCPCVGSWIDYLQSAGLKVRAFEPETLNAMKIPKGVNGCHIGRFKGLFVDGHVPKDALLWAAQQGPSVLGIAAISEPYSQPERHLYEQKIRVYGADGVWRPWTKSSEQQGPARGA